MKLKATITDIQRKEGTLSTFVVGVEVLDGDKRYLKAFQVDASQKMFFTVFRERLIAEVIEDIKKEGGLEGNMQELTEQKGKQFELDIKID
jgi:hypothetical protein